MLRSGPDSHSAESIENGGNDMSIRIGILGYGNLSRGVESAIAQNSDLELAAVFTRRDPASVKVRTAGVPVLSESELLSWKDKLDCMEPDGFVHPITYNDPYTCMPKIFGRKSI